jgi:multidrug efflux system outer membrane protein
MITHQDNQQGKGNAIAVPTSALYKYSTSLIILCAAILLLFLSGCKTYSTNVSIAEKDVPKQFSEAQPEEASAATIQWKQFFDDPHLIALIDTALVWNPDLNSALQRIEVARASTRNARGAMLPQVSATTLSGIRRYGLYTMDGAGNISTEITPGQIVPVDLPDWNFGLQASWEIDIWGKLRNQRKSAATQYLASIEGTHFVISSLVNDIAVAYYTLLALDSEIAIIREFITKQEEALEVIKLQKESGRTNELAVQQFHAQLLQSKTLEVEAMQRLVETENLINFLIGRYPQPIERNQERLFNITPKAVSTGIPTHLLSNRPDVREAELMVAATKYDLKSAKAAFYPNLNILGSVGFQAFSPEYLLISPQSIFYTALVGMTAPLINRNGLKAQFHTAKANQLDALYDYQKSILNAYTEVSNQVSKVKNLQQIFVLKKEQSDVLAASVETSSELYRHAKIGYIEVLLSQQNALQSLLDLVEVSKRQHIATVNIYKALGGGWQ